MPTSLHTPLNLNPKNVRVLRAFDIEPETVTRAFVKSSGHGNKRNLLRHYTSLYASTGKLDAYRQVQAVARADRRRIRVEEEVLTWGIFRNDAKDLRLANYTLHVDPKSQGQLGRDVLAFFRRVGSKISYLLGKELKHSSSMKVNTALRLLKFTDAGDDTQQYSRTAAYKIHNNSDVAAFVDYLYNFYESRAQEGSAQHTKTILSLHVDVRHFAALSGAAYIESPKFFRSKKGIINPLNRKKVDGKWVGTDEKCFLWCILLALAHRAITGPSKGDKGRLTKDVKKAMPALEAQVGDIPMPMAVDDVALFEKRTGIPVHVWEYVIDDLTPTQMENHAFTNSNLQPVHCSKLNVPDAEPTPHIVLVLYKGHYFWCSNWSALTNHNGEHKNVCKICLSSFRTFDAMHAHMLTCNPCENAAFTPAVEMPKPESVVEFTRHVATHRKPAAIYLDFESILVKQTPHWGLDHLFHETGDEPPAPYPSSEKLDVHVPIAYRMEIIGSDLPADGEAFVWTFPGDKKPRCDTFRRSFTYTSTPGDGYPNAAYHLIHTLRKIHQAKWLIGAAFYRFHDVPTLTAEEQAAYNECQSCPRCKKKFGDGVVKVRDHDHTTGAFRQAMCRGCNLKEGQREFFNQRFDILAHNMVGYDSHLIVKAYQEIAGKRDRLSCLASNGEKFLTLDCLSYRFIDSCQFLQASLDSLLEDVPDERKTQLRASFPNAEQFAMCKRKAPFPYAWFDSVAKLQYPNLPPQAQWYDQLNAKEVTDEDYAFAHRIWKQFGLRNFGEYMDLYLKIDVMGLADVFEEFRSMAHEKFGLDPLHYCGLPGFAWDSMLKTTKARLELISEEETYVWFEQMIRGGVSVISTRHATANNRGMGAAYDPRHPTKHLMYWDANSLYPTIMQRYNLPTGNFRWRATDELPSPTDVNAIMALHDCALEVDIHCPWEHHDKFSDYPLCPLTINIKEDDISTYSRNTLLTSGAKFTKGNRKLVGDLRPKTHYKIHCDVLKFALQQGYVLTKVHKLIEWDSSNFMKVYIDQCVGMRKNATSEFEKLFWKLMINIIYGKTCESVRGRTAVHFETDANTYGRAVSRRHYKRDLFWTTKPDGSLQMMCYQMNKRTVKLDKTVYLGACILDLSKLHMQRFHYEYVVPTYGPRAQLMFTDTDSLCYCIETEDAYADAFAARERFDFSNYEGNNRIDFKGASYDRNVNKKQTGFFKDEVGMGVMFEFRGLRSKVYMFKYADEHGCVSDKGTCKGVNKSVKRTMTMEDYNECARTGQPLYRDNVRIVSQQHSVATVRQHRKCLSAYDDKRYLLPCGVRTLAYGHWRIPHIRRSEVLLREFVGADDHGVAAMN